MNSNIRGIVIDPGHGGDDPGATGNGIVEKDYNLKISKYMYDKFKELGIPVVLTRDSDITLTPKERVNKVLNAFGDSKDVLVISNHINAGGGDGAEVIYALRNDSTLANNILSMLANAGQNIRGAYQRRSMVNPTKDYYFMQRNTGNTEAITIEYSTDGGSTWVTYPASDNAKRDLFNETRSAFFALGNNATKSVNN